jgi:hypothetical protein
MYYQQTNERQNFTRNEVQGYSTFSARRDIQLLLEQRTKKHSSSLVKMIYFHSLIKYHAVNPASLAASSASSRKNLQEKCHSAYMPR